MKDFDKWNSKKKKIDAFSDFQHPKEKEIWWCRIGLNVGTEVYGKGEEYTRPVLVVNAESSENCIIVPLTSKLKNKKYSCIIKTIDDKLHSALVFQIKNADKRRFKEKIYSLADDEYAKVKECFDKLYKI